MNNSFEPFLSRLQSSKNSWNSRCSPDPESGLLLFLMALLLRPIVLRIVFPVYYRLMMLTFKSAEWIASKNEVATYRLASDLCKVVVDAVVLVAYVVMGYINSSGVSSCGVSLLAFLCTAIAVYRLVEVMAISLMISFDPNYTIKRMDRAIANTLWHYLEIAAGFGLLYSCVCYFDPSAISNDDGLSLGAGYMSPLYFSVVTLFTVGYGDFSPASHSPLAMALACFEMFCGAFLLLVVLQRSFSGGVKK